MGKPSFYDEENEIDKAFGAWLKERRLKKGFSINYASDLSNIPYRRLWALEEGMTPKGITRVEVESLAEVYGIDPRAILKRAISG